jgi:L-alanine-DL-glutamate epimerase-like enolase superfamily enzyme
MRITAIEAIPLWASFADAFGGAARVPDELARPAFGMRATPLAGQGCTIVRVFTDAGIVGIGEAMGRPGPGISAAAINEVLAPMLIGGDPLAVEAHWAAMSEELRFAPMPLSGVDIALWDIRGQVCGASIASLLGGPVRAAISCYASPIPFLPTPEQSAAAASRFVQQGFKAVKLKIGRGIATDLDHVAAVRAALGPATPLLVDANGAYRVAEAVQLARGLVREDVFWLEEPVHPEFPRELAQVRRRVELPIASGEWLGTPAQFRDLLDAEGADVLMPNVTRCGGITGLRKVAELAAARAVAIAPHGVGGGVGIVAALHGCAALTNLLTYEYNQLFNPLRHDILTVPLHFADGELHLPSGPGLGTSVNLETVERYRTDRAS